MRAAVNISTRDKVRAPTLRASLSLVSPAAPELRDFSLDGVRATAAPAAPAGWRPAAMAAALSWQALLAAALIFGTVVSAPPPPGVLTVVNLLEEHVVPAAPAVQVPAPRLSSPILTVPTPRVDIALDAPASTAPTAVAAEAVAPPARASGAAAVADFQRALLRHLDSHKRYPAAAKAQRAQGVVHVRFSMDRRGRVLTAAVARSSRFVRLDEEGLALLARAQPLPLPPAELAGDALDLIVPIEFSLR